MAELFNKSSLVNDDLIRETLKTGLSGIKPSDELIQKTIEKCSMEYRKANEKENNKSFIPWIYKLGAPIAAGALLITLALNTNNLYTKYDSEIQAPEAPNYAIAGTSGAPEASADAAHQSAEPEYSRSASPDEEGFAVAKGADMGPRLFMAPAVEKLDSLSNKTSITIMETGNYNDAFVYLVNRYNSEMGTLYDFDENSAALVYTVRDDGLDSEELLSAKSYWDILDNEGYWILPLKNENKVTERLLAVNKIDSKDKDKTVSSNDVIYEYQQDSFLVTPIFKSFNDAARLFDTAALKEFVHENGYAEVTDPVIADINNGNDFIAFMVADNQEVAVPLFSDSGLFGLESNRVYQRDQLFSILSSHLEQN